MTTNPHSSPSLGIGSAVRRPGKYAKRRAASAAWQHLYKTARWLRLRERKLADDPLCERHNARGKIVAATVVHHLEPHHGDEVKFFSGKLESLCKQCHDSAAQSEEAGAHLPRYGLDGRIVEDNRPGWSIPFRLRPSRVPVHIVVGPPGAGKTTYARTHAKSVDLVIDFDEILVSMGARPWSSDGATVAAAFKIRDRMLHSLCARQHGEAWLTLIAPTDAERSAWVRALGKARVHAIETDIAICRRRIMTDRERVHARGRLCRLLEDYERARRSALANTASAYAHAV